MYNNNIVNMAITVQVSLISILLLCITIAQGRETLHTSNQFSASSLVNNDDGICKTMVETQGYTCEEHKAYWDWSWDELASYDLPASVEYVYNYTGQKMHYVGHSQGTLMAFAALSQGQLLDMLRSVALLSPIAHMNQISSIVTKLAADLFIANDIYWLGIREFNPNADVGAKFLEDICNTLHLNCANLMSLFTGPNCCINSSRIDVYLDHELHPTSTKNLIHFSQKQEISQKYDYVDQAQNVQHYGQQVPPNYDLTKIPNELPLFLGYGEKDMLGDVQDVKVLLNDLQDHDAD
ncbi:hypothetical protein RYX36_030298 [Vicia faba]